MSQARYQTSLPRYLGDDDGGNCGADSRTLSDDVCAMAITEYDTESGGVKVENGERGRN